MTDRKKGSKKGRPKEDWEISRPPPDSRSSWKPNTDPDTRKVRIRGRRRWMAIAVVIMLYGWLYMKLNWPSTITDIPEIAARLYAKEYCSCLFVMGQTYPECRRTFGQYIPAFFIDINHDAKIVDTQVFWVSSRAVYQNERLGCMNVAP